MAMPARRRRTLLLLGRITDLRLPAARAAPRAAVRSAAARPRLAACARAALGLVEAGVIDGTASINAAADLPEPEPEPVA